VVTRANKRFKKSTKFQKDSTLNNMPNAYLWKKKERTDKRGYYIETKIVFDVYIRKKKKKKKVLVKMTNVR